MDRSNHYEAAFEAYLQWHRLCYVAVDETRRATLGDTRVKSLDFLVFGHGGSRLLVDVKGRRFPGGKKPKLRWIWQNWCMREDLDGLARWAEVAGPGYQGLLVFAYHLQPEVTLPDGIRVACHLWPAGSDGVTPAWTEHTKTEFVIGADVGGVVEEASPTPGTAS